MLKTSNQFYITVHIFFTFRIYRNYVCLIEEICVIQDHIWLDISLSFVVCITCDEQEFRLSPFLSVMKNIFYKKNTVQWIVSASKTEYHSYNEFLMWRKMTDMTQNFWICRHWNYCSRYSGEGMEELINFINMIF